MVSKCLKPCLELLLVICYLITAGSALRADLQKGFKMCPGKQLGQLVSVEINATSCWRPNGELQWPCLAITGDSGVFTISFIHEQPSGFNYIYSSINAIAKVRWFGFTQRVEIENNKDSCPQTYYESVEGPYYGCPIQPGVVHTLQKTLTVPGGLAFVQNNIDVETKLTDSKGDTIVCFISPMVKS